MTVLIFEDNLLWSAKLSQSLKALGHESVLLTSAPDQIPSAQAAIVNLGSHKFDLVALVQALKQAGVKVIGHAGHKEKELHELGRVAGVDLLSTNGQITFKIEELLMRV